MKKNRGKQSRATVPLRCKTMGQVKMVDGKKRYKSCKVQNNGPGENG
jgi:hypothetical protein